MQIPTFQMERMQSLWEHVVEIDLSESGVEPIRLRDLREMGLDVEAFENTRLGYSQTNGTIALRQTLCEHYAGAMIDNLLVTNGTSEANFLAALTLLGDGDEVVFETPNYMQMHALPSLWGATVRTFSLRGDHGWEPDWDELQRVLSSRTRFIYVTNPNNPTGSILSNEAMERLVDAAASVDAYLVADEVYQGAELDGELTPSFWGLSDRVIVNAGLSKSYGIPGARIGWMVAPSAFIAHCWANHDYLTIGPSMLSDMIAQTAVRPENRRALRERAARYLGRNMARLSEWVEGFDGLLDYWVPQAGAFAFVRYHHDLSSVEFCERLRNNRDVLIVPGAYLGMEGYLRIGTGVPREVLDLGLARIGAEFAAL